MPHQRSQREQLWTTVLFVLLFFVVFVLPHIGLDDAIGQAIVSKKLPLQEPRDEDEDGVFVSSSKPVTPATLLAAGYSSTFVPQGLASMENKHAKLQFSFAVDVSTMTIGDFRDIKMKYNRVFIEAEDALAVFAHVPVTITFYNVPYFPGVSRFLRYLNDGQKQVCEDCLLIDYGEWGVTFFAPQGFSGYGVQNPTPPGQLAAAFNASSLFNAMIDTLFCQPLGTFDVEGDPVAYTYQYKINSVPYVFIMHPFNVNVSSVAGGAIKDISGNGFNGTLGGGTGAAAPKWVGLENSVVGGAYSFDGVDDFLLLRAKNFPFYSQVTFEAWVNATTTNNYRVVIGAGNQDLGYSLGVNDGNGNLFFGVRSSSNNLFVATASKSLLTLNEYHHLAGVYDGIAQTVSLYLDGALVGEVAGPAPVGGLLKVMSFGNDNTGDVLGVGLPGFFGGTIDEVQMYLRALSPEQIASHAAKDYHMIMPEETTTGDTWTCLTIPSDGYFTGYINESAPLTIMENQAPTQDQPLLSSSSGLNTTQDDYTCMAKGVVDAEGDAVVEIMSFVLNSELQTVLLLPFEISGFGTKDFGLGGLTVNNAGATFVDEGKFGGGYQFDGVDDYIFVNDVSALDFGVDQDFSLELWMKPLSLDDVVLLSKGHVTTASGFSLSLIGSTGQVQFQMHDGNDVLVLSSSSNVLSVGEFSHVAVAVDRDGLAGLYVDGVLQASGLVAGSGGIGNIANDDSLLLGSTALPSASYFKGVLDEVRLYNYTLSSGQVSHHAGSVYNVLDSSQVHKGQQLACVVKPHDGYSSGESKLSNAVTVLNTLPTHANPSLTTASGDAFDNETLLCLNQNTQDIDGDIVTNFYTFLRDGEPLDLLYLPFEAHDDSALNTSDYSSSSHVADVSGAVFNGSGGVIGGAYQFDGVNDYVVVEDDDMLDGFSDLTLEFWVRFDVLSDHLPLLVRGSDVADENLTHYGVRTGSLLTGISDRELEFFFDTNGTTKHVYTTTGTLLEENTWYHVAVVKPDGGEPTFYVDGVKQEGVCVLGGCSDALEEVNESVKIGKAMIDGSEHFFAGALDEVRVMALALPASQVGAHANLSYSTISGDVTTIGDKWACGVRPHDGEDAGETKYSEYLTLFGADGPLSSSDGSLDVVNTFVWDVNATSTVTYTFQSNWMLWIHNLTAKVKYVVTAVHVQQHEGKVTLDIYPNIGALVVTNETALVDLDVDGDSDITITASGLGFDIVTLTFALTSAMTPLSTSTPPPLPSGFSGTIQPGSAGISAPLVEQPAQLGIELVEEEILPEEKEPFVVPYKSIVVTVLVLLIIILFFVLQRRVRHG